MELIIHYVDNKGRTALDIAKENGSKKMISLILSYQ